MKFARCVLILVASSEVTLGNKFRCERVDDFFITIGFSTLVSLRSREESNVKTNHIKESLSSNLLVRIQQLLHSEVNSDASEKIRAQ